MVSAVEREVPQSGELRLDPVQPACVRGDVGKLDVVRGGVLADALVKPSEPGVRPTLPMPAGGIKYQNVAEVLAFYGTEVILLIGGGLYEAGDDSALSVRAEEFVRHVAEARE